MLHRKNRLCKLGEYIAQPPPPQENNLIRKEREGEREGKKRKGKKKGSFD